MKFGEILFRFGRSVAQQVFLHRPDLEIQDWDGMSIEVSDDQSPRAGLVSSEQLPGSSSWTFRALPYREAKRRFWHIFPGLLSFGLLLVAHADPISPTLKAVIVGCCMILALRILLGFRQIQRQGEGNGVAAVSGYAFSVLLTILMFPRHLEIGLGVLSILAFGDGSATMFGLMLRGPRLPWNQAKSCSGLMAFCVIGTLSTASLYWGETWNAEAADPGVSFPVAVMIVMPAVIAAALAESLRSKINDNIRVGIVASMSLATMHFLIREF